MITREHIHAYVNTYFPKSHRFFLFHSLTFDARQNVVNPSFVFLVPLSIPHLFYISLTVLSETKFSATPPARPLRRIHICLLQSYPFFFAAPFHYRAIMTALPIFRAIKAHLCQKCCSCLFHYLFPSAHQYISSRKIRMK